MPKIKNQLGAGVILSYVSQGVQIIVTLFYTPVMLKLLGQSEYGLYQLVYSVVSYLSLFTFGFSSAYIKFYAQAQVDADPEEALKRVNGMFLTVFSALGLIVLLVGGFLVVNTDKVLGSNLTSAELETCRILMAVMVLNCAIHFPTVVFNNYIIAKEKFVMLQVVNLIGIIMNPCLTFPLLLLGFKSVALAAVLLVVSVTKFIAEAGYCFSRLNIKFTFHNLRFSLLKDVSRFSFYIFIESVVSTINVSLDRFLLGRMVGSVSVAIYSVGGQINTLYTTLSTSISSVFTPRINKMVASGDKNSALSNLFVRVGKIQFFVLYLILLGYSVFGQRFMLLWAGEGYENSYYVAMILIWPNTINLIQNIAIEIQRAKNLQKYRSYMYLGIAIVNIIISCIFICYWQEVGAALGTCFAWIVGSGFLMNWFYSKRVGLDIKTFWKEILFMAKGGIPLIAVSVFFLDYINSCSIAIYFVEIVIFAILYLVSMFFLGCHNSERTMILSYVKSKVYRSNANE